jgi:hypothetical protein
MDARKQTGQGLTEYAVMLAVLLMLAYGTVKLVAKYAGVRFENAAKVLELQ